MSDKPVPVQKLRGKPSSFSVKRIIGYESAWPIHTFFMSRPRLFYFVMTVLGRHLDNKITSDTKLVISGAGGSANTYALDAVQSRYPDEHFASHQHAPMEVIRAIQLNLPCIVLVRHPLDAISSLTSRGGIAANLEGMQWALKDYVYFYQAVMDLTDHYVAASFDQVVTDYPAVMEKVNQRFSTDIRVPNNDSDEAREIVELNKWRGANRRYSRKDIKEFMLQPQLSGLVAEAVDAYTAFCTKTGLDVTEA